MDGTFAETIHLHHIDPKGYVAGFSVPPAQVTVTVTQVPTTGVYTLVISYANNLANDGKTEKRHLSVLVNNQLTGKATFAVTPSWDDWLLTKTQVPLQAGSDDISLACVAGDECHVNIDWIKIMRIASSSLRPGENVGALGLADPEAACHSHVLPARP